VDFIGPGLITASALILLEGGLLAFALIVAPRGRMPASALAWILVIAALPGLGLLLYALIGHSKLPQDRRDRQRSMNDRIEQDGRSASPSLEGRDVPAWLGAIARLNRRVGAMPLLDGNAARILPHFEEQLQAVIDAVDGSKRTLHVLFFILALDDTTEPVFAALERAVQRGVTVRVLLDHIGSLPYPGTKRAEARLTAMGAEWHLMLPVKPLHGRWQRPDLRNHRKLLVADGTVALVGSLNLIDPGYEVRKNVKKGLRWRDLLVELHGPIVREVDALFVTDWYSETDELLEVPPIDPPEGATPDGLLCQVAPSGPAFPSENNLALFNGLIYAAEQRIGITSPYFVPDESLLIALVTAANRGVEVELFVGAISDKLLVQHAQHSYYRPLLEAGVRIHCYAAPTILHAKHVTVDDLVCVVGSSNLDRRSFDLDLELSLLVCDRGFTAALRAVEDEYRGRSTELTLEDWDRRTRLHRFGDDLARLTSALQ
jgi:cardiolipin synthase